MQKAFPSPFILTFITVRCAVGGWAEAGGEELEVEEEEEAAAVATTKKKDRRGEGGVRIRVYMRACICLG